MEKVFSLDEANTRIPQVTRIFDRIAALNEQAMCLSRDVQDLFEIWGDQLQDHRNPDHDLYEEKRAKKQGLTQEIQEEIHRVHELGGVVKDLKKGLVDFYFEHAGEPVYLCWKQGEDRILHWHPIRGGFAKRRPISELAQAEFI